MANQQPFNNSENNHMSTSNAQVPFWDEFNLTHHDEDTANQPQINEFGEGATPNLVCEPAEHPEEFGPSLPPGIGGDDSRQDNSNSTNPYVNDVHDFSIPIENYDLDDPEDPLQGSSSGHNKKIIGPQIPSSILPKIIQQKSDEQFSLPSLGDRVADFIPTEQPCSSSSRHQEEKMIGPALPPEFTASVSHGQNIDELEIGPGMPPDEPKCSSEMDRTKLPISAPRRKQTQERSSTGPTLPTSSDEEEERDPQELPKKTRPVAENAENGRMDERDELKADELIGPMPPAPGRTDEEEQMEYFCRLAQFESNKQTLSKELKREEWMTELPQKMLKSGAFGLTAKTSFSRSTANSSLQSDLWTKVPNGDAKRLQKHDTAGPSTSASGSSNITPAKRSEKDEWEEQLATALNKDRDESLLEIHQKKHKLDKGGSSAGSLIFTESGGRRPFNRDSDMEERNARGKGPGNTADLKKRMGDLSNRFGNGNERKFL